MKDKDTYPKNVKDLLYRGFLTQRIKVGGITLTIKTLNETERDLIEFLKPSNTRRFMWEVVFSLFMIDNSNVLAHRPDFESVDKILKEMTGLNREFLQILHVEINKLASWYFYEFRNVYRFSLESESRNTWSSYRHARMNDSSFTGIAGTDKIGLNAHQCRWRVYNELEDADEVNRFQWSVAKFVVSAWAGSKEIQKLNNKEKMQEEELEAIKKRILAGEPGFNRIQQLEETVQELERQIKGDKDEFDLFIEEEEIKQKTVAVKRIVKDQILSQEMFRRRDVEYFVIGDDDFVEVPEIDLVTKALKSINRGSLKAELKLDEKQTLKLIEEVREDVLKEIEENYGNISRQDQEAEGLREDRLSSAGRDSRP